MTKTDQNKISLQRGGTSFVDHLCYFCIVFVMHLRLLTAALWSPAGKELTSWLSFAALNCVFVTFPCDILGQVWYLIASIPDLWPLSYFHPATRSIQSTSTDSTGKGVRQILEYERKVPPKLGSVFNPPFCIDLTTNYSRLLPFLL